MADSDDFPTRIHKSSIAAIDSIFFDYTRINPFKIATLINGLSDHDTRHLILTVSSLWIGVLVLLTEHT